ncbi:collagen-like protein [Nodularia sp. UHCC 0506]|uniref:collagen-like protein n=1 Tax=Nodularia sp. UHCC 0506 TaxID=3110243 RepID=UPI002B1EBA1D|nr:collagen-like protein [Nodularia sp. UHCC 0506]MEA5512573.1 collagen-like protein [Nodularia sp. UHCC 0506]
MHRSFRRKLPLLVIFSLFTSFLPASGSVLCPVFAHTKYDPVSRNHSRDGSSGTDGRSGRNGRDGEDKTIFVDGSSVKLDLSGENGEDGENGRRGYRPDCHHQGDKTHHDIYAPSGGTGGNGGNGGIGGNGGSLTLYYTNLADLQKIFAVANPGDGGRGGRGGRGAYGCRCHRRSWEIETCTGTPGNPDYKCTKRRYRCYDGRIGNNGINGRNGSQGRLGKLRIINSQETLATDNPTLKLPISQLIGQQFNLSRNQWHLRQGGNSLLAPGSVIADEYREFAKRLETDFQLVWAEKEPITSFNNQFVTASLTDSEQVEVTFADDLWVAGSSQTEANLTTFTVNHAISQKDVTRLAVAEFAEAGENLKLNIVDLAAKSAVIQTQFQVKFRAQDRFAQSSNYTTVYQGVIPAELVTRDYNRFILALGKLKIPDHALRPGVNVDIEVVATRTLGKRSAKQTINWRGAIRNPRS